MEYTKLNNGVQMPLLGFGAFQLGADICEKVVSDALEVGYRMIDGAQDYRNEAQVGAAIAKSGIARKDIFLTSKVWCNNFPKTYDSVMRTLDRLQTDYLDLMLVHQPFGDFYSCWRELEKFYEKGVIKAIGVSNFRADRLIDLHYHATVKPMVNQIEAHPYFQREDEIVWNRKLGVQVEAYAPFAEAKTGLFTDATLQKIAQKYGKTVPQVALRWNIDRGIPVIPKSVHKDRMQQNFDVFDFKLDDEDKKAIAALETGKTCFFSHIDYAAVEWVMTYLRDWKDVD